MSKKTVLTDQMFDNISLLSKMSPSVIVEGVDIGLLARSLLANVENENQVVNRASPWSPFPLPLLNQRVGDVRDSSDGV